MKVKCAWCNDILEYDSHDDGLPSHGICMVCAIKVLEEAGIDPNPYFVAALRKRQPIRIIQATDAADARE
jgi:hypothetical protein